MTRQKQQGTAWETELVARARAAGLTAHRLAEGGSSDLGDVLLETPDGDHYVLEAKATERLALPETLAKAEAKVAKGDPPWPIAGVAVAWKRYKRNTGAVRRSADVLVALRLEEYLELIRR